MARYNTPEEMEGRLPSPRDYQQGLLTYEMRAFIRGEKDLEEHIYTQARQRMRDRIRAGVRDFIYLRHLSDQDMKTLFKDVTSIKDLPDDEVGGEPTRHMTWGIPAILGFVYDGIDQHSQTDFETLLEDGLNLVQRVGPDGNPLSPVADVDIDVNWNPTFDAERLLKKIRNEEPIRPHELSLLITWGHLEEEDWDHLKAMSEELHEKAHVHWSEDDIRPVE